MFIVSPLVFFLIYSHFSKEASSDNAIKFGIGVGVVLAFFLSIAFLKRAFGKPWEGIVMSKKVESHVRHRKYGTEEYQLYILGLTTDTGNIKFIQEYNHSGYYYQHFNVEDRVKYYPSFDYYEKFDKTNDREVLCPFCSNVVSIERNKCSCGAPVIK